MVSLLYTIASCHVGFLSVLITAETRISELMKKNTFTSVIFVDRKPWVTIFATVDLVVEPVLVILDL